MVFIFMKNSHKRRLNHFHGSLEFPAVAVSFMSINLKHVFPSHRLPQHTPVSHTSLTGIPRTLKWKEFPKINCFLWGTCGVCSRGYVGKFLGMIFFSSYFGDRRSAMTQASTLVAWILLFLKMQVKVAAAGPKLPMEIPWAFFQQQYEVLVVLVYTLQV